MLNFGIFNWFLDDELFLKLHLKFIKKHNVGVNYEQAMNELGDMTRYYRPLKKLVGSAQ